MTLKEFIKQFRQYSNDEEKPYLFSKEDIEQCIAEAMKWYSKKNPILRESNIDTIPKQKTYPLPTDYQTWYEGLENVDIVGNDVIVENPCYGRITFLYYANRRLCEVAKEDLQFFFDYCFGALLEKEVLESIKEENKTGTVKAMKLGRGLDLTFDESKNIRQELLLLAREKKQKFFDNIKRNRKGIWI